MRLGTHEPEAWRGARLRALAELQGVTLSQIARDLGLSTSGVSRLVTGEVRLSVEIVARASEMFSVPPSFFSVSDPDPVGAVTFRKKAGSGIRQDRRVVRMFLEASRLWVAAAKASGAPSLRLPRLFDQDVSAEDAAMQVRNAAGLDEYEPVRNVVRLAERLGVAVVCGLDPQLAMADPSDADGTYCGLTLPSSAVDRPLVATVRPLPGAVQRMTLAHEIGHLVLDADLVSPPRSRDVPERRAFDFAGALLLPERPMRECINSDSTLADYLKFKSRYGVSVGAIVMRAQRLGLIDSVRAKSLHIQISSRGWRVHEPVEVIQEKSLLLAQASDRAWPVNTVLAAATQVGLPANLVKAWLNKPDLPEARGDNVISLASRR